MVDIKWTCPNCGWKNEDSFVETTFPMCGYCSWVAEMWDELLTPEQMDEANRQYVQFLEDEERYD